MFWRALLACSAVSVGTMFITATTSFADVVVSISALRSGAVDPAIGNRFGSIILNMFILAVDDILYTAGSLFAQVSSNQVTSGFAAVAMTAIPVISLTYRAWEKTLPLGWLTLVIVLIHLINIMLLYALR